MAASRILVGGARAKSAWLALNLSAVLPGLGQIYGGAVGRGVAIATAHLGLLILALWSIFSPPGNTVTGLITLGLLLLAYGSSLWDSYQIIRPQSIVPATAKATDPWYAVLLSHVLPGLGQLYQQQVWLGGILLGLAITTAFAANYRPHLLPIPPLIWAVGCWQTYRYARPSGQRQWGWLTLFLTALITVRTLVGFTPVLTRQVFEQCIVPNLSMLPTLAINDRIFVRKWPTYQPEFRDIIVFYDPEPEPGHPPLSAKTLIVKRVIALPGQQVEIKARQVWVNGRALVEPYVVDEPKYNWGPATVPANSLFVLGDNRNNSRDSHVWGFLPQQNILGKATKIYWPPARIQPLT